MPSWQAPDNLWLLEKNIYFPTGISHIDGAGSAPKPSLELTWLLADCYSC